MPKLHPMPKPKSLRHPRRAAPPPHPRDPAAASPLVLCDHLIALAQEAERAGYPATAGRLVSLVDGMFEERPGAG